VALCIPPVPPNALLHDKTITDQVHDTTRYPEACKHACVGVKLPVPLGHVGGTDAKPSINANQSPVSPVDLNKLIELITQIGEPDTPTILTPAVGSVDAPTPQAQPAAAGSGKGGSCNPGGPASPGKGKEGEDLLKAELQAQGYDVYEQISARAANGVPVRFDLVARKGNIIRVFDAKNGPRAEFSKNQGDKGGYESIENNGGTWYGRNAAEAQLQGPFSAMPVEIQGYGGYPWTGRCR
jgi:hypothetical protein